jgi:hypothetical protein
VTSFMERADDKVWKEYIQWALINCLLLSKEALSE